MARLVDCKKIPLACVCVLACVPERACAYASRQEASRSAKKNAPRVPTCACRCVRMRSCVCVQVCVCVRYASASVRVCVLVCASVRAHACVGVRGTAREAFMMIPIQIFLVFFSLPQNEAKGNLTSIKACRKQT